MSQKTINSYFSVKKHPVNQRSAKSRKLDKSQDVHSSELTISTDDHLSTIIEKKSTPAVVTISKDVHPPTTAGNKSTPKNLVSFQKGGKLSPCKIISFPVEDTTPRPRVVTFPFEETASPSVEEPSPSKLKATTAPDKRDAQAEIETVTDKLEKYTPAQVKAKLGKVKKLADLKARFQELNKDKTFKSTGESVKTPAKGLTNDCENTSRQLFSPPKLSKEEVTIEVVVPKTKPIVSPVTSPVKAGIKASPRKDHPAHLRYDDLRVPDKFLPLPRKYKFLAEVFRSVDDIVAMKFNRREIIRVSAMKPAVQNIIRKTFDNSLLRQIRCVFPKSYIYTWEKILDRLGRHSSGDYELHMVPDLNYNVQGSLVNYNAHGSLELQEDFRAKYFKLGPKERIERVKLFNHALLEIAKEYHKEFLNSINWTKEDLGKKEIFKWHPKFDPEEHCPDIDTVDFPPKPHVERISNAKDMIQKFAGIHPLLQNLAKERESQTNSTTEHNNPTKNLMTKIKEREPVTNAEQANIIKERKPATNVEQPKIIKGLRGLDPAILKMLVAKEKTRTVQEITQDSEKRKRLEIMDELILVAPYIVNCHRSVKNGAAVPIDTLTKIVADSYGQGKTKEEILKHVKMFLNLVPECMELKTYDRICYLKKKKDSPDINVIKAKLRKLADQEKES